MLFRSRGARLLLAVSGGQHSMALTILLRDLQPLYGWELALWHGDHGWHPRSATVATELLAWARVQGLTAWSDQAPVGDAQGEAAARRWRYGCLEQEARQLGCGRIVTGHTASDRAETLLFHLIRGSGLRGLASLRACRPLAPGLTLVRPLLGMQRSETLDPNLAKHPPGGIHIPPQDLRALDDVGAASGERYTPRSLAWIER